VATPVLFAGLTLLHPMNDPWELGDAVPRWMAVHVGQLVLTILLAYSVWLLLSDLIGRSATVARAALPVFLVAFSAFDAVAGIATGWLAMRAEDQTVGARAASLDAIEHLFADNWLAGNLSVLGGVTAVSWVTLAIAAAVALRSAGADRMTVWAMCGAVLFASHPAPIGTIGLLAFTVAAWRWTRRTLPSAVSPTKVGAGA
jgi:hypothetical protein